MIARTPEQSLVRHSFPSYGIYNRKNYPIDKWTILFVNPKRIFAIRRMQTGHNILIVSMLVNTCILRRFEIRLVIASTTLESFVWIH